MVTMKYGSAIFEWQGTLIETRAVHTGDHTTFSSQRYQLCHGDGGRDYDLRSSHMHEFQILGKWKIIKTGQVTDHKTGIKYPTLLAQCKQCDTNSSKYCLFQAKSSRLNWSAVAKVIVPHQLNADEIFLTSGPNICFAQNCTVYYTMIDFSVPGRRKIRKVGTFQYVHKLLYAGCFDGKVHLIVTVYSSVGKKDNCSNAHVKQRPKSKKNAEDEIVPMDTDQQPDNICSEKNLRSVAIGHCMISDQDTSDSIEVILDSTDSVPEVYASIIDKILILELSVEKFESPANQPQTGSRVKKPESASNFAVSADVLCCTTKSQLLRFRNGGLASCVKLPFSDASTLGVGAMWRGTAVITVMGSDGLMCVIDKSTFKILQTFEGYQNSFIGDFCGSGNQQLLLTTRQSTQVSADWTQSFLLTDLGSVHVDKRKDQSSQVPCSSDTTEGIQVTCKALLRRLQLNQTALYQTQQKLQQTDLFLHRSVTDLLKHLLGQEPVCTNDMGLIPLPGCKHDAKVNEQSQELFREPNSVVTARDIWWKTFEQYTVFGCDVTKTSEQDIYDPELTVIATGVGDAELECLGSAIHPDKQGHSVTPDFNMKPKRRKLDCSRSGGPKILITDIAQLNVLKPESHQHLMVALSLTQQKTVKKYKFQLLVRCKRSRSRQCQQQSETVTKCGAKKEVPAGSEKLVPGPSTADDSAKADMAIFDILTSSVGDVTVNLSDLVSDVNAVALMPAECINLNEEQAQQNVSAMDCVQVHFDAVFKSAVSNLGHLEATLISQTPLEKNNIYDCLMSSNNSLLRGARVHLHTRQWNTVHADLYFRDVDQFVLLLSSLYSALPDDVIIEPCHHGDHLSDLCMTLTHIGREVTQKLATMEKVGQNSMI